MWLTTCCSIVEYATRDQAQNAVNTLSNQNLMGRLVYVREVRPPHLYDVRNILNMQNNRIANRSPASVAPAAAVDTTAVRPAEASAEATVVVLLAAATLPAVSFSFQTFVAHLAGLCRHDSGTDEANSSFHTLPVGKTSRTSSAKPVRSLVFRL